MMFGGNNFSLNTSRTFEERRAVTLRNQAAIKVAIKQQNQCPITLEDLTEENLSNYKMTQCGHVFKDASLRHWLEIKPICPACRSDVRTTQSTFLDEDLLFRAEQSSDVAFINQCLDEMNMSDGQKRDYFIDRAERSQRAGFAFRCLNNISFEEDSMAYYFQMRADSLHDIDEIDEFLMYSDIRSEKERDEYFRKRALSERLVTFIRPCLDQTTMTESEKDEVIKLRADQERNPVIVRHILTEGLWSKGRLNNYFKHRADQENIPELADRILIAGLWSRGRVNNYFKRRADMSELGAATASIYNYLRFIGMNTDQIKAYIQARRGGIVPEKTADCFRGESGQFIRFEETEFDSIDSTNDRAESKSDADSELDWRSDVGMLERTEMCQQQRPRTQKDKASDRLKFVNQARDPDEMDRAFSDAGLTGKERIAYLKKRLAGCKSPLTIAMFLNVTPMTEKERFDYFKGRTDLGLTDRFIAKYLFKKTLTSEEEDDYLFETDEKFLHSDMLSIDRVESMSDLDSSMGWGNDINIEMSDLDIQSGDELPIQKGEKLTGKVDLEEVGTIKDACCSDSDFEFEDDFLDKLEATAKSKEQKSRFSKGTDLEILEMLKRANQATSYEAIEGYLSRAMLTGKERIDYLKKRLAGCKSPLTIAIFLNLTPMTEKERFDYFKGRTDLGLDDRFIAKYLIKKTLTSEEEDDYSYETGECIMAMCVSIDSVKSMSDLDSQSGDELSIQKGGKPAEKVGLEEEKDHREETGEYIHSPGIIDSIDPMDNDDTQSGKATSHQPKKLMSTEGINYDDSYANMSRTMASFDSCSEMVEGGDVIVPKSNQPFTPSSESPSSVIDPSINDAFRFIDYSPISRDPTPEIQNSIIREENEDNNSILRFVDSKNSGSIESWSSIYDIHESEIENAL